MALRCTASSPPHSEETSSKAPHILNSEGRGLYTILLLSSLLLLATFSTKLAFRIGVPGLVIFLGLGMLFGSDGLNLIYFDDPLLAKQIANAALIIILFQGGFTIKREVLRLAFAPAFSLATVGVLLTAVVLGLATH